MLKEKYYRGCFLTIVVFFVIYLLTNVVFSLSKNITQKEVSEYLKLLDAKIAFNKAQGNVEKVKQLREEKQKILKQWKKLKTAKKKEQVKNTKEKKKVEQKKDVSEKELNIKKTEQLTPSKILAIQKEIKRLDIRIAKAKKLNDHKKVALFQSQKAALIDKLKKTKATKIVPSTKKVVIKEQQKQKVLNLEGGVGVWLNNGHTSFRVLDTQFSDTDPQGNKAPEGTRFYVVKVEIKNSDPFTTVYGGDYHKAMVIDSKKVYYMENVAKNPINWAENDVLKELLPGESFETAYVFTIPIEATPEKFVFDVSSADKFPVMRVSLK